MTSKGMGPIMSLSLQPGCAFLSLRFPICDMDIVTPTTVAPLLAGLTRGKRSALLTIVNGGLGWLGCISKAHINSSEPLHLSSFSYFCSRREETRGTNAASCFFLNADKECGSVICGNGHVCWASLRTCTGKTWAPRQSCGYYSVLE